VRWGDAADVDDLGEGRQQQIRLGDEDLHNSSEEDPIGASRDR
jgi:hypothetical protein